MPQQTIVSVNPFRCRLWHLHDRLEEQVTEENCRSEIESVARHGQLVPALGRRVHNDPMYDVELIFGARRLFVARHLNVPLRVELREMSDREAIFAMDIENRQRKDISPYERGVSYARWLREGYFGSQDDIARALKMSASQVSRFLKIARLPPVVLNAFSSVAEVCESWGLELAAALDDPTKRAHIIRVAREIAQSPNRAPAPETCHRLLAAPAAGRKPSPKRHPKVICDDGGHPLFRVRQDRTCVALLLPVDRLPARLLEDVCGAVKILLQQPETSRRVDDHRQHRAATKLADPSTVER